MAYFTFLFEKTLDGNAVAELVPCEVNGLAALQFLIRWPDAPQLRHLSSGHEDTAWPVTPQLKQVIAD